MSQAITEKFCPTCRLMLPIARFRRCGAAKKKGWRSQCRTCWARRFQHRRARHTIERKHADARFRVKQNRKHAIWMKARNDASRVTAARHRSFWTGAEIAVASDPSLTARHVAATIGRTVRAVEMYRRRFLGSPVKPTPRKYLVAASTSDDAKETEKKN
jgi:hypothetical protein